MFEAKGLMVFYENMLALNNVSLACKENQIVGVFGANSAGKSTLINIICGALYPSGGSLVLDGRPITLSSVKEARDRGIAAVFQEFSLAPDLTIEENLFLGRAALEGRVGTIGTARTQRVALGGELAGDVRHHVANVFGRLA